MDKIGSRIRHLLLQPLRVLSILAPLRNRNTTFAVQVIQSSNHLVDEYKEQA